MKCSLGISNFLEGISRLSHSIVFLYFFALITEESFLISSCYSLELCIHMGIPFLFSFAFLVNGMKIARRNINNLRNVDDTTLMGGIKEELKNLSMKVKEERENLA